MLHVTHCLAKVKVWVGRGSCQLWDVINDRYFGGGSSQSLSWLPSWPMQWPEEWEEDRERKTDKQREMTQCGGRKKGLGKKRRKKRGSTCFNFSLQWNEGHGRRGRWVSEREWSIIYLSSIFLTLIPLSFFPLFPSFHASVLLFLASRGSVAKANKQRRLFISASGE